MKRSQVFKTIQWNIGGALNHDKKNKLNAISKTINRLKPQLITLQEVHVDNSLNQIQKIAQKCGYSYWLSDNYSISHLDKTKMLAQGIISVFSLKKHNFSYFNLPKLKTTINGKNIYSHKHGLTECFFRFGGKKINLKTLHSLAYYKFNLELNSLIVRKYREELEAKLSTKSPFVIQGDFNYDNKSLKSFLPGLITNKVNEAELNQATTLKGKSYDHIIASGLKILETRIILPTLIDHCPILTTFALK